MDGKVVVVTGAGRGIGRSIAITAAEQGARVVVNDLGTGPAGDGANDTGPAQEVVAEITAAGGEAVANTESVASAESAETIVATALDTFGQIDVVVNNAGILRDRIFHQMTAEEWDPVINTHLMGSFYVSRAAAPHFRSQESGTFVQMISTSGLIGNFGQSNYAAAKAGMVALSKSIALDMARYGVRSNALAPFAWSRLAGTIPPKTEEERLRVERLKTMTTDKVAVVATFLASDISAPATGQIFGVRQNEVFLFSQPRPLRSVHRAEGWTPATLAEHMATAFEPSYYPLDRTSDVISWDPI
jgi:NAD(P)-dependent dehydrogenase (short-subunit alcohol dehydrogenase family)